MEDEDIEFLEMIDLTTEEVAEITAELEEIYTTEGETVDEED